MGFNISEEFHGNLETTVMLSWERPGGSGPEAVVDNYTISISPPPPYQPTTNLVRSSPWNVTLTHNVEYTINITAMNCVGRSGSTPLHTVEFGE